MRSLIFCLPIFLAFIACESDAPPTQLPEFQIKTQEATEAVAFFRDSVDTEAEKQAEVKAIAAVQAALELAQLCDESKTLAALAEACHKLGFAFYRQSRTSDAKYFFGQALALRTRAFPGKQHHLQLHRSHYTLGLANLEEKNFDLALQHFSAANDTADGSYPSPFIPNLVQLGNTYRHMKELNLAAECFLNACRQVDSDISARQIDQKLDALNYLSDCQRGLRQFEKAIETGRQAIAFARKNEFVQTAAFAIANLNLGNAWQDSLVNIASPTVYQKKLASDSAIFYTNTALNLFLELKENAWDLHNVGAAWRNLGEFYRRAGDPGKAIELASNALNNDFLTDFPTLLAELHINRGEAWLDSKKPERALTDYHQALRYLVPGWKPVGENDLPSTHLPIADQLDLLLALSDIANAHLGISAAKPQHLLLANQAYDTLIQLANRIRGDFLSSDAKLHFAGVLKDHLRKAFEVSLDLSEEQRGKAKQEYLERAFSLSEQSKAVALLEAVRLNHFSSSLPPKIQEEEQRLQNRRTGIENELFEQAGLAERKAELQRQWLENFEQWRRFQEKLKHEEPAYFQLRYAGADLSVSELQKNGLAADQGLIEYFFNDSVLHIFLVTRENFKLESVPMTPDFPAEMDSLLRLISNHQASPQEKNSLCLAAHRAWKTLLQPLGKLPKRLVIVPDQPFQLLPFEALLSDARVGNLDQAIEKQYFVLFQHDISYCFSSNLLTLMKTDDGLASLKKAVAAFAPNFPKHLLLPAQMPAQMTPEDVTLLQPIENQDEAQAIGKQACSKIYTNEQATKAAFLAACKKYSVVHAATHGFLNHREPNFNFIALHQSDSFDARQILKLSELNAQEIRSKLIVFSACETAAGKNVEGEGTMSMARGLAYAGVNSLISTLFLVRAQNNSEIFSRFYESLVAKKEGLEMDGALADAKRQFAAASSNNYHPANWAAVVLIGDTKPPEIAGAGYCGINPFLLIVLVLGAAAGLILLVFWRRRSKRKN